jgi:hypothetical protein
MYLPILPLNRRAYLSHVHGLHQVNGPPRGLDAAMQVAVALTNSKTPSTSRRHTGLVDVAPGSRVSSSASGNFGVTSDLHMLKRTNRIHAVMHVTLT